MRHGQVPGNGRDSIMLPKQAKIRLQPMPCVNNDTNKVGRPVDRKRNGFLEG